MTTVFNEWFPTSKYGTNTLNVMDFGAFGDGLTHVLSGLTAGQAPNAPYANLAAAQVDYPSASSLSDTADWAAITECFKHAFMHETSPGVWVTNGTAAWLNRPVHFPNGRFIVQKPLRWHNIQGGYIFGSGGGTSIHNDLGTPGDSSCVLTNGFCYCRVENISFSTVGGETSSKAFDLNSDNGATTTVATNACTFFNCGFSAPVGIGIAIGDPATFPGAGYMSSEIHFYHCTMNYSGVGIYIANWNALNYSFIGCGGIFCGTWMYVGAGGFVTVVNGSLAANDLDINVGAGSCTVITTRSESEKFVYANGPTSLIGCSHTGTGNSAVMCKVGAATYMFGCDTTMGRLNGEGPVHLENCTFNSSLFDILTVIDSPTAPGTIRLTHVDPVPTLPIELWLNGDQVEISDVTGTGAASINGVWNIAKINRTTVDLVGSVFGGTYTNLGTGAKIKPGPQFHLVDNVVSIGAPSTVKTSGAPSRPLMETKRKNYQLFWSDSGKIFNNLGATGPITIRLPNLMQTNWSDFRGTKFTFVVMAAQTIDIEVDPTWAGSSSGTLSPRIFRAGGAVGTHISSNVVGNSIEIILADGEVNITHDLALMASRWLAWQEAGTWTLAGTPP